MKNMKIAVLYGGFSSEREVSLKTGRAVFDNLIKGGYKNVHLIDVDKNIVSNLLKIKPDVCFNALHGKFGEDGVIQGLLESMSIKYTGSNVSASAVAFDKALSKMIFDAAKLPTANYFVWEKETLPEVYFDKFVVKPAREGSTIGVSIVSDKAQLKNAISEARKFDKKLVIEKFIEGKELTVGILGQTILPPIWIKPKKGFYDFESKYTKGMTEYIFETELSGQQLERLREVSLRAFNVLGCSGAARVDLIYDGSDFNILEVNTSPGMTETSLLPNAARKYGLDFLMLVEKMLEMAIA